MAAQPLPRFLERHVERRDHSSNLGRALREQPELDLRERTIVCDPSDAHTLRGIPAIGRGVGGAIRGTRPDQAVSS